MIETKKEPRNGFTFSYIPNKEKEVIEIIYGNINVSKMIVEECFSTDVHYLQQFTYQFPERLKEWITKLFKTAFEYKEENNILYGSISSHIFSCMNVFSNYLINKHLYVDAGVYWRGIIRFLEKWKKENEKDNITIHKGAPYGWLALINIMIGDIESAFLLLHNAIGEDTELNKVDPNVLYPETAPSYYTLSLSSKRNNFLAPYVDHIRSYITAEIEKFNNIFNRNLDIAKFDVIFLNSKFLDKKDTFKNLKFNFVYYVCSIVDYKKKYENQIAKSEFSQLNKLNKILGICVLIESLVKFVLNNKIDKGFAENLRTLSIEEKWCKEEEINKLIKAHAGYEKVEKAEGYIKQLLNLEAQKFSNEKCVNVNIDNYSRNLTLLYVLRNFSAHNAKALEIIDKEFYNIFSSLMSCIFLITSGDFWKSLSQKAVE